MIEPTTNLNKITPLSYTLTSEDGRKSQITGKLLPQPKKDAWRASDIRILTLGGLCMYNDAWHISDVHPVKPTGASDTGTENKTHSGKVNIKDTENVCN